jgi:hypothetical protein
MNNWQLAGAILVDPRPAFAALDKTPRFWFAILAPILVQVLVAFWYFGVVDYAWLVGEVWSDAPGVRDLPPAQQLEALPSRNTAMWSTVALIVLIWLVTRIAEAVYFSLAGKMIDARKSFRHWMALTAWSSFPYVLAVLVMLIPLLMQRGANTTQEGLSLLSLNELLFHLPRSDRWHTLLSSLTVLHPWLWWLTVTGFRAWSGRSLGSSVLLGLAPTMAVYGLWVLYVLL